MERRYQGRESLSSDGICLLNPSADGTPSGSADWNLVAAPQHAGVYLAVSSLPFHTSQLTQNLYTFPNFPRVQNVTMHFQLFSFSYCLCFLAIPPFLVSHLFPLQRRSIGFERPKNCSISIFSCLIYTSASPFAENFSLFSFLSNLALSDPWHPHASLTIFSYSFYSQSSILDIDVQ